LNQWVRD